MKISKVLGVLAISTAVFATACVQAEAAPAQVGANYVYNTVIDEEGAAIALGTEVNNVRFGLSAFNSSDKLESYGVYAGVPLYVQGTKFGIVPKLSVEHYRDISETVGGVGLGVEYNFTETFRLEASGVVARSFDSSDVSGEIYSVGVTKTFN